MAGNPNVNELLRKTLKDNGVAVSDFTAQILGIKFKYPLYIRPGSVIGIVMHNTSGMVTLPNLVGTFKNNSSPSHLAIDKSGAVGQYISLEYADRATEHTNRHISIEFQAVENGGITGYQITSAAIIAAFSHVVYGIDLAIAESRTAKGLAHHSLFVNKGDPGAHANCPGLGIISRKGEILEEAKELAAKMVFDDEPAGRWQVKVEDWVWIYTFDPNGSVTWLDPFNKKTGRGTWKINGKFITFSWVNSTTKENWELPLKSTAQNGNCTIDGKSYVLHAVRL